MVGPGETLVNLMGDWIVPRDEDGDGRITAMSFYYAPFDGGSLLRAVNGFERASTVEDFRQAMRHVIGFGLNFAAADREGSVVYTGYHAMPCRTYLPRDPATGRFEEGADPSLLIDGTRFGAWRIPLDAQGRVDEAAAAAGGPTACAVPFDEWPQALNPARQYVHNANNDPGAITTEDNDPWDDPYYIGGPWDMGYRASRIASRLEAAIASGTASLDAMQSIQGDHHSNVGEDFVALLIEGIGAARDAAAGSPAPGSADARIAAAYSAMGARFDEVESRMSDWRDDGLPTPSGVDTFYDTSTEATRRQSVATMIFAAWMSRFIQAVWNDEGIDGGVNPGGDWRLRTLDRLVRGRGATDPLGLPSFDPATGESVFFDDITTPEVESSQELVVRALEATLAYLGGPPGDGGATGGFGTDDMNAWIWGLRHQVRFESLLSDFIGDDPSLSFLFDMFNLTTGRLPLAEGLSADDPRAALTWFPRPGDQYDIDAANPGYGGTDFTHRNGPVMRVVVALGPDGVEGRIAIPGGQSGNPDSEHFADRAPRWLGNTSTPLRFTPAEVAAGAVTREVFAPR
ncbi:MAG: penicillin acylase family protein [Sandaracinaceae bacterium]|nr:penicillin acylase family protein [Sandaracinaceae bacterium]